MEFVQRLHFDQLFKRRGAVRIKRDMQAGPDGKQGNAWESPELMRGVQVPQMPDRCPKSDDNVFLKSQGKKPLHLRSNLFKVNHHPIFKRQPPYRSLPDCRISGLLKDCKVGQLTEGDTDWWLWKRVQQKVLKKWYIYIYQLWYSY